MKVGEPVRKLVWSSWSDGPGYNGKWTSVFWMTSLVRRVVSPVIGTILTALEAREP